MTSHSPGAEGGCLCGAIRYRLREVRSAYWCHCTMCRRSSGSNALPWATVARGDFEVIRGTLKRYTSSPGVERGFCANCGSPILFDMADEAAVDVTLGTLDAPDSLPPTHHIWTAGALAMSQGLGHELPRYEAEKPLESGD